MESVPKVSSKTLYNSPVTGIDRKKKDSSFDLERADLLLKKTNQYKRWRQLRQKNDNSAMKAADLIIKRHELLEKIQAGVKTDKKLFNELNNKLSEFNIFLYSWDQLREKGYIKKIPSKIELLNPKKVQEEILELNEELILQVRFKRNIISEGIIGLKENGEVYYPLKAFSGIFNTDFRKIDNNKFGIKRDNFKEIIVDTDKNIITKKGKELSFNKNDFLEKNNQIFLSSQALSEIFDSDLKLNYSEMFLSVDTAEDYSFKDMSSRNKKRVYSGEGKDYLAGLTPLDQSYSMFRFPLVDFQGNLRYESDENKKELYDYSVKGKGEFLKAGLDFYIQGDEDDNPDTAELTAERISPKKESFFDLTRVAAGDVKHDSFDVTGSGSKEKGVKIESRNLYRSRDFDVTEFEGNLSAGWDVELYRNNVLIKRQSSDEGKKFEFDDVPLFYGQNRFRLVYYGPQGEKRTEEKVVNIGSDMLQPGETEYGITLSEKEKTLLSFEDEVKDDDYGSAKITSVFSSGVGKNLSVEGGFKSEKIDHNRHNYYNIGLRGSYSGVLFKQSSVFDDQGGSALQASAQTRFDNVNMRLKNTFYDEFIDESSAGNPVENRFEASFSGIVLEDSDYPISWTLNETHVARKDSDSNFLSTGLGYTGSSFSLYNYNSWDKNSYSGSDTNNVRGYLHGYLKDDDIRYRTKIDYSFYPEAELEKINISAEKSFNEKISSEISFENDFEDDTGKISSGLNYDSGKFVITPKVSADTRGEWEVRTDIGFSIGRDPNTKKLNLDSDKRSYYGEVSALVYEDENLNSVKDKNERVIRDAFVKTVNRGQTESTGEDGTAHIKGISAYRKEGIVFDESSLKDPYLVSSEKGYSFYPRAGRTEKAQFPVYTSAEITGKVFRQNKNGVKNILPYEKIRLKSEDGKISKSFTSEYDGSFVLERIKPGEYILTSSSGENTVPFTEKIKIEPGDSLEKDIIIQTKTDKKEVKKEESIRKVLYENGEWKIKGAKKEASPEKTDRSVILYKNGKWEYGTGKIKGTGVHVASFENFDNAKSFIEKNSDNFNHNFYIKEFENKGRLWHRVVYGSFESWSQARKAEKDVVKLTGYSGLLNFK
jgi:hypothetical protein